MVQDFGKNRPTADVIEKEFKMKPEEFDKQFLAWLDPQNRQRRSIEIRRMDASDSRGERRREGEKMGRRDQEGRAIRDLVSRISSKPGSMYEFSVRCLRRQGRQGQGNGASSEQYSQDRRARILCSSSGFSLLQHRAGPQERGRRDAAALESHLSRRRRGTPAAGRPGSRSAMRAGAIREFKACWPGSLSILRGAHFGFGARPIRRRIRRRGARGSDLGSGSRARL